jgi:hypothetical protein
MNRFLKVFLISFSLYITHILATILVGFFYQEEGALNYGILGAAFYILIVAFWAYYILILVYLLISNDRSIPNKMLVSIVIMLIGYLISRGGDIIDGDFKRKFNLIIFVGFIASAFLIVWFDQLIVNWGKRKR